MENMKQLNEFFQQEKEEAEAEQKEAEEQVQELLKEKAEFMDKLAQQEFYIEDLKTQVQNSRKKFAASARHLKTELDRQKEDQNKLKVMNKQLQNEIKTMLSPGSLKVGEVDPASSGNPESLLIRSLSSKLSALQE